MDEAENKAYLKAWVEAIVDTDAQPLWSESQWWFNERAAESFQADCEAAGLTPRVG